MANGDPVTWKFVATTATGLVAATYFGTGWLANGLSRAEVKEEIKATSPYVAEREVIMKGILQLEQRDLQHERTHKQIRDDVNQIKIDQAVQTKSTKHIEDMIERRLPR